MTKRGNLTKVERWQILEKKVAQLEMATRVSQAFLQQVAGNSGNMSRDLGEVAARQRELQYRQLAFEEISGTPAAAILKRAEELQVKDFNEASDKEDAQQNFTVAETVGEESSVIITSKIDGQDGGILRSRLRVAELGFPQLRDDMLGKKTGDVVEADINGKKHSITILGIRQPPVKQEEPAQDVGTEQSATEQKLTAAAPLAN